MNPKLLNKFICADAFDYIKQFPEKSVDLMFTSVPDIAETDNTDIKLYIEFLNKSIIQIDRVIKDEGFLVFSQTDRKIGGEIYMKHVTLKEIAEDFGFKLKDYKIMVKDRVDKINLYRLNYSHVLIMSKTGKIPTKKRKGKYLQDVWVYPYPNPGLFDQDFCNLIIETLTKENDLVLDPFAGRGTVLKSALELKRNFFGTEINKEIYDKKYVFGNESLDFW
ncbi:MAG: site-specific DNA-methyltransferase [Bacteroidetes bacterium]|nr:site-specific DNA-methyltransferase [Bacteroidota bacterium]